MGVVRLGSLEEIKERGLEQTEERLYHLHEKVWCDGFNQDEFHKYICAVEDAEREGLNVSEHNRLILIYKNLRRLGLTDVI